ncbi:MAG: LegC family aminotransferase [Faecalibacterium sp.]|nr:LegC family aminotransferase [Faecalibacterium sp.]
MSSFIPLSVPNFCGNEKKYVNDALDGAWVSTSGAKVDEMEACMAAYLNMPRAVCCASGSSALHLSAIVSGIQRGDEVIVPDLTFIASVNPTTRYVGAEPVFIGCDETACLDPDAVEDFCANCCTLKEDGLYNNKTGAHVSALVVVHVFGNMADMPRFLEIAKKYKLILIEDAAEALGTKYTAGPLAGKFAGTIGDVGAYSFNGNKIITTGTGGTLVSNHDDWAARAKHISTQAKTDVVQFTHDQVGYNYRMTNIDACLGLAQMELLEGFIQHKIDRYQQYKAALDGVKGFSMLPFREGTRSNHWFYSLLLPDRLDRDTVIKTLHAQKIQTRPVWALIHEQCDYGRNQTFALEQAKEFRRRIVNIPCSTNLTEEECARVIDAVLAL